MKYLTCLIPALLVSACVQNNLPTAPDTQPRYYLDFTGYGETMEPGYVKIFSDSSWQEYGGIDTVNGTVYLSLLQSDSSLTFYTLTGERYAGYKLPGEDPVIFDAPLPPLPGHWPSDSTFARTATFALMGNSVSITDFYTLVDTAGVVTPVGIFSPAPHFEDVTYLQSSNGAIGYASQDLWLARGPGVILTAQQAGPVVYFVRGFVNGISWGIPAAPPGTAAGKSSPRSGVEEILRTWKSGAIRRFTATGD